MIRRSLANVGACLARRVLDADARPCAGDATAPTGLCWGAGPTCPTAFASRCGPRRRRPIARHLGIPPWHGEFFAGGAARTGAGCSRGGRRGVVAGARTRAHGGARARRRAHGVLRGGTWRFHRRARRHALRPGLQARAVDRAAAGDGGGDGADARPGGGGARRKIPLPGARGDVHQRAGAGGGLSRSGGARCRPRAWPRGGCCCRRRSGCSGRTAWAKRARGRLLVARARGGARMSVATVARAGGRGRGAAEVATPSTTGAFRGGRHRPPRARGRPGDVRASSARRPLRGGETAHGTVRVAMSVPGVPGRSALLFLRQGGRRPALSRCGSSLRPPPLAPVRRSRTTAAAASMAMGSAGLLLMMSRRRLGGLDRRDGGSPGSPMTFISRGKGGGLCGMPARRAGFR